MVFAGILFWLVEINATCITCTNPAKNDGYCVREGEIYNCGCDSSGSVNACLTGASSQSECGLFGSDDE